MSYTDDVLCVWCCVGGMNLEPFKPLIVGSDNEFGADVDPFRIYVCSTCWDRSHTNSRAALPIPTECFGLPKVCIYVADAPGHYWKVNDE
jgi:hypothetical protein